MRRGCYVAKDAFAGAETDPRLGAAIKAGAAVASSRHRDCVASHHSAARVHGIEMLHPPDGEIVTLTVEPGRQTGRRMCTDVLRHAAGLPDHHVTKFHGVPLTTVARTVVDIARTSTFMQGVAVADSALRNDPLLKPAIRAVLRDCERWPGIDKARRVTEFADWVPESVLESCARVVFRDHGLPPPLLQTPILGRDGRPAARVDFCWPEFGTVAEADGMLKYRTQKDLERKYHRDTRIQAVGWEVVHFSWAELFADGAGVIDNIRAAFQRGREPSARKRRGGFTQAVG
ncbi:MAG: hypothetical protein J2P26_00845 [Nocardiopsaceae bacterium]|nr:hypothetical protein [Nocardiopsaceae bacterium]